MGVGVKSAHGGPDFRRSHAEPPHKERRGKGGAAKEGKEKHGCKVRAIGGKRWVWGRYRGAVGEGSTAVWWSVARQFVGAWHGTAVRWSGTLPPLCILEGLPIQFISGKTHTDCISSYAICVRFA